MLHILIEHSIPYELKFIFNTKDKLIIMLPDTSALNDFDEFLVTNTYNVGCHLCLVQKKRCIPQSIYSLDIVNIKPKHKFCNYLCLLLILLIMSKKCLVLRPCPFITWLYFYWNAWNTFEYGNLFNVSFYSLWFW